MKVSVIVPVHDKPKGTILRVLEGLQPQGMDQLVIVMDRPTPELRDLLMDLKSGAPPGMDFVNLDGPPGWRSPCISFNAGLERVTGDITIINHSDVVQAPGNLEVVRQHFITHPNSALFARVLESDPHLLIGPGHAGPVLCASTNTRALTFLTAAPTHALRDIGGWDLAFQAGVCYEDDDLTARLWKYGLDFYFSDAFQGTHLTHSRAYFKERDMAINMQLMLDRHLTTQVYRREIALKKLRITTTPGLTTWTHL